eukprot:gnl/TRDRNA2_/TRDRNA2_197261_c0_seq1.p1 gnl/TRDRNA2_/TRDRNA2_197261_c0~~gnl/TRDRNA2_/TRDRNA2_197261_c0_seq1.p1  ORF type:complete len:177 (-),score=14.34 gnl/TRDRNA2_/TRDRNA2_197261_c0_seq1:139-669(-)
MCFPHKDHRVNMLHSLAIIAVCFGICCAIGNQPTQWACVLLGICALFCTNKCCFMFLCISFGVSALACFALVGAQSAVMFVPEWDLRGALKDMEVDDSMLDITDTNNTFMHYLGFALLIVGCGNGCFQFMLAYYSWEVYHYQGPVEDLRYGPGHDGRGHVVGVHDAEQQPMVSQRY